MYFLIDIDGTVANLNLPRYLDVCNKDMELGIPAERLHGMSIAEFCVQPEARALQARHEHGERRFVKALKFFQHSREVLLNDVPIEGAREGVERLSEFGTIAYCTGRGTESYTGSNERMKEEVEIRNRDMVEVTLKWLAANGFPNADRVMYCAGAKGKLIRIAELIEQEGQPAVYIDNQYDRLLEKFPELDQSTQAVLVDAFTLCAMWRTEVPADTKFPVVPLPTWQHVEQLLTSLNLQASEQEVPL